MSDYRGAEGLWTASLSSFSFMLKHLASQMERSPQLLLYSLKGGFYRSTQNPSLYLEVLSKKNPKQQQPKKKNKTGGQNDKVYELRLSHNSNENILELRLMSCPCALTFTSNSSPDK